MDQHSTRNLIRDHDLILDNERYLAQRYRHYRYTRGFNPVAATNAAAEDLTVANNIAVGKFRDGIAPHSDSFIDQRIDYLDRVDPKTVV